MPVQLGPTEATTQVLAKAREVASTVFNDEMPNVSDLPRKGKGTQRGHGKRSTRSAKKRKFLFIRSISY